MILTLRTLSSLGKFNSPIFWIIRKYSDTYHAIAFWTLHKDESDTNKNYGDYVISIDELEQRTGIDFFCNLPDEVEKTVEAETDLNFWKLTTTP